MLSLLGILNNMVIYEKLIYFIVDCLICLKNNNFEECREILMKVMIR